ncbi:MAG: zinc ribbon domain-containing protein [Parabacteroides sp.]|nr:zinc ribbon domain-containing protein [Parabacteroides sp.]
MICSNCGNKVNINDKSCNQCGNKLSDEDIDMYVINSTNSSDYTVYKLSSIITLIAATIVLGVYLLCCNGNSEYDNLENKESADDSIWKSMTIKAKNNCTNPKTYSFESQKDHRLNDSISLFIQKYTYKNDYGVKKSGLVMGFYNIKQGYELSAVELEPMTSDLEMKIAENHIK